MGDKRAGVGMSGYTRLPAPSTFLGTFTGQNYRATSRVAEPAVSMPQAILAALALALFVVGGLLVLAGVSL